MKTTMFMAQLMCGMLCAMRLMTSSASCQEQKQEVPERELVQLGKQIAEFYVQPTSEQFDRLQKDISTYQEAIELANKKNGFANLCATFLARVNKKHGYTIQGTGPVFELAREINKEASTNKTAQFINDKQKVTPNKLDVWWISFYATGEEDYLSLILAQTGDIRRQDKGTRIQNLTIKAAANWSFQSNCRQHPAVRAFAARALKQQRWASKKGFLSQCIERAEGKGGLPEPAGDSVNR